MEAQQKAMDQDDSWMPEEDNYTIPEPEFRSVSTCFYYEFFFWSSNNYIKFNFFFIEPSEFSRTSIQDKYGRL